MEQQLQPALVPLRGRYDHLLPAQFCHSFLQPSFCIMLFAAACSAQACVSAVLLAGVCMSFCLILTTTLRSLVVFCHGASGASEAPLMPHFALKLSQSCWVLLQSLLNRLGPKSKRSPGTACFAQLLSADHIDNNFFAGRWTPEARVGVASPATSGASSEAKHRRLQSTCGLQMQCLNPRIMLSTSLCSANMLVFLFSHMFLHTALMRIFSPNMSLWHRLPPAADDLSQELSLLTCVPACDLVSGRTVILLPCCAFAGALCRIIGQQCHIFKNTEFSFLSAALACLSCCRCLLVWLQRAHFMTCLRAPVSQTFAFKWVGGSPDPLIGCSVPLRWSFALPLLCRWKLSLDSRPAFGRLPRRLCGWYLVHIPLLSACCLHWLTCVSLLAAPASVRFSCGSPLGGCSSYIAARCLGAPPAQDPLPWAVLSSTRLHGASRCSPSLPAPAIETDDFVTLPCCFRYLRRTFWVSKLGPSQASWCMSVPQSPWLLYAFLSGWLALRRVLGILLGVVLFVCLRDQNPGRS